MIYPGIGPPHFIIRERSLLQESFYIVVKHWFHEICCILSCIDKLGIQLKMTLSVGNIQASSPTSRVVNKNPCSAIAIRSSINSWVHQMGLYWKNYNEEYTLFFCCFIPNKRPNIRNCVRSNYYSASFVNIQIHLYIDMCMHNLFVFSRMLFGMVFYYLCSSNVYHNRIL